MAIEMKVPSVGESVTEVTIASWVKKDGDRVELDEVICELESDKATFELPAEAAGILKIIAPEGETLQIGSPICSIDTSGAPEAPATQQPEQKEASAHETPSPGVPSQLVDVKIPAVGESITQVTVSTWMKKTGDTVELDEIICELESDKATFELPSPAAGVITTAVGQGSVVQVGELVATVALGAAPATAGSSAATAGKSEAPASTGGMYASGHPSPAAAKILAEKGIEPSAVKGSGPDGRITKEDAMKAEKIASTSAEKEVDLPTATRRGQRREGMTTFRKAIAKRLVDVKNETAMLTTFNEVDMKPIMDLRKSYKDKFKDVHGVGLGFMSFFTKASAIALQEFPVVNASIDDSEVIYHDYADISIAVSAPKGLMVPVIRNAEGLSFAEIESEVVRLATKARDNKLSMKEMEGGTFTITNGGIFGSMLSTPIINSPQSAILGMHNIVERPVAINGQVEIRPIMYVALSYDHRTIDGKDSVRFLVRIKELLEDPMRMLLGV